MQRDELLAQKHLRELSRLDVLTSEFLIDNDALSECYTQGHIR
jgi:hypothetical protein